MKTRPDAGFITRANEGAAKNHLMFAIETRRAEIRVIRMDLEIGKGMEWILTPLPDVAEAVMKSQGIGRERIHGTLTSKAKIVISRAIGATMHHAIQR